MVSKKMFENVSRSSDFIKLFSCLRNSNKHKNSKSLEFSGLNHQSHSFILLISVKKIAPGQGQIITQRDKILMLALLTHL